MFVLKNLNFRCHGRVQYTLVISLKGFQLHWLVSPLAFPEPVAFLFPSDGSDTNLLSFLFNFFSVNSFSTVDAL